MENVRFFREFILFLRFRSFCLVRGFARSVCFIIITSLRVRTSALFIFRMSIVGRVIIIVLLSRRGFFRFGFSCMELFFFIFFGFRSFVGGGVGGFFVKGTGGAVFRLVVGLRISFRLIEVGSRVFRLIEVLKRMYFFVS